MASDPWATIVGGSVSDTSGDTKVFQHSDVLRDEPVSDVPPRPTAPAATVTTSSFSLPGESVIFTTNSITSYRSFDWRAAILNTPDLATHMGSCDMKCTEPSHAKDIACPHGRAIRHFEDTFQGQRYKPFEQPLSIWWALRDPQSTGGGLRTLGLHFDAKQRTDSDSERFIFFTADRLSSARSAWERAVSGIKNTSCDVDKWLASALSQLAADTHTGYHLAANIQALQDAGEMEDLAKQTAAFLKDSTLWPTQPKVWDLLPRNWAILDGPILMAL